MMCLSVMLQTFFIFPGKYVVEFVPVPSGVIQGIYVDSSDNGNAWRIVHKTLQWMLIVKTFFIFKITLIQL